MKNAGPRTIFDDEGFTDYILQGLDNDELLLYLGDRYSTGTFAGTSAGEERELIKARGRDELIRLATTINKSTGSEPLEEAKNLKNTARNKVGHHTKTKSTGQSAQQNKKRLSKQDRIAEGNRLAKEWADRRQKNRKNNKSTSKRGNYVQYNQKDRYPDPKDTNIIQAEKLLAGSQLIDLDYPVEPYEYPEPIKDILLFGPDKARIEHSIIVRDRAIEQYKKDIRETEIFRNRHFSSAQSIYQYDGDTRTFRYKVNDDPQHCLNENLRSEDLATRQAEYFKQKETERTVLNRIISRITTKIVQFHSEIQIIEARYYNHYCLGNGTERECCEQIKSDLTSFWQQVHIKDPVVPTYCLDSRPLLSTVRRNHGRTYRQACEEEEQGSHSQQQQKQQQLPVQS